jgi:hypothetical protein
MNYTKGEWKVDGTCVYALNSKRTNRFFAGVQHGNTDTGECTPKEELEANANLIASAVNACVGVNPDNPQAVAESIKDMYEALKGMLYPFDRGLPENSIGCLVCDNAIKAINKAEGN